MRLLGPVVLLSLLVSAPASAMGRYVGFELVAWNPDGTAVLVSRVETSSGTAGATHQYILVGARDATPLVVSFDDTQDPDTASQKIDRASCLANAATLKRALTARRFRGVTVRPERCKRDRDVVSISALIATQAEASRFADLTHRSPTSLRELHSKEAAELALGAADGVADVASPTGALVLVMFGVNADESSPAHAVVVAITPTGPRVIADDLR